MDKPARQHITVVGAVYIDTILTTSHYPEEDSKLRASTVQVRRGGNGANSLEIIMQYGEAYESTLSMPTLISALPSAESADFQFIRDSLPGVKLLSGTIPANAEAIEAPRSWIIRSQATTSRTIINHVALQELSYGDLASMYRSGLRLDMCWWHFEGRNVEAIAPFIKLIRQTQANAIVISLEIEKPGRPGLQELAHLCDYVFYSRSFAVQAGFSDLGDFLTAQRQRLLARHNAEAELYTRLVFGTWGEAGSGVIQVEGSSDCKDVIHVPSSLPTDGTIVDTVGAGDVFIGSIVAQLAAAQRSENSDRTYLRKLFLDQILQEANAHCGIKICQEGFSDVRKAFLDGQK